MYGTIKAGGSIKQQQIMIRPNLINDVSFLSGLLKFEFVYKSLGIEGNLKDTLKYLIDANVVSVGQAENGKGEFVTLSDEERRVGRETFDFYCFLLWPFVETYWLASVCLYTILPKAGKPEGPYWVEQRLFLTRCQIFGRTLYYEGDLSYFEAINKETLMNAFFRLKDMGLIIFYNGPKPNSGGS
jgi:hypothetical protein